MLWVKPQKITVNYATTSYEGVILYIKRLLDEQPFNGLKENTDNDWLQKKLEERLYTTDKAETYIELMLVNNVFPVFYVISQYKGCVIYKAVLEVL